MSGLYAGCTGAVAVQLADSSGEASLVNITVRLRPDPLVVAGGAGAGGGRARGPTGAAHRHGVAVIMRYAGGPAGADGDGRVASDGMVAVMAMTSVHLRLGGHEEISQFVVSAHIGGMFAFSSWVGRFRDRRAGCRPSSSAAGCRSGHLLAVVTGDGEWLMFPAMWRSG